MRWFKHLSAITRHRGPGEPAIPWSDVRAGARLRLRQRGPQPAGRSRPVRKALWLAGRPEWPNRRRVRGLIRRPGRDIEQKLAATKPDGHTALLDAIYLAVTRLHSARYERKAILIISDGGDNHSRYGLGEIKSLLQESGVEVYAIGIFDTALFKSFEEFMGKRWLGEITDPTGGRTVAATSLEKVPEIAAAISREVRNQYVLAYRPSNQARNGKWRKIKVQVTPPPPVVHVQAYYKKRYLAPNR